MKGGQGGEERGSGLLGKVQFPLMEGGVSGGCVAGGGRGAGGAGGGGA